MSAIEARVPRREPGRHLHRVLPQPGPTPTLKIKDGPYGRYLREVRHRLGEALWARVEVMPSSVADALLRRFGLPSYQESLHRYVHDLSRGITGMPVSVTDDPQGALEEEAGD